jgi:hypothetical protein
MAFSVRVFILRTALPLIAVLAYVSVLPALHSPRFFSALPGESHSAAVGLAVPSKEPVGQVSGRERPLLEVGKTRDLSFTLFAAVSPDIGDPRAGKYSRLGLEHSYSPHSFLFQIQAGRSPPISTR